MSYAWIDIQTTGLTIEVLIRRKSDMAVWDGDSWEADSGLTDAQLEACAIAATEVQTSDTTTIGYKVDVPAGVTVESEIHGYNGGYTAGDARTWVGDYLVGNDSILAYDPPTKSELDAAIGALGVASGTGLNYAAESSTLTTGVQTSGTYASTEAEDGTYHQIDDTGDAIDIYYQFDVGGIRTAVQVIWKGYVVGSNDAVTVQAYDWVGEDWETVKTIAGTVGGTNQQENISLLTKHTGTGANAGKVRIKFTCTGQSNPTLYTDQILVEGMIASQSVGYADGAIWVDTNESNENTTDFVDGVADNPVSTWAAALTLSASLGIKKFHLAGGSSVTLTADSSNYEIYGHAYDLALNGQTITNASISGARVSGTGVVSGTAAVFEYCGMAAVTLGPSRLYQCGIGRESGALAAGSAGQFVLVDCFSLVPGAGTPTMTFNGTGATTGVNIRGWKGGTNITLDSDCTLSLEVLAGGGQTIVTGGADVEIRGCCRAVSVTVSASEQVQFAGVTGPITITDNASTAPTINLYGVASAVTDGTSSANDYTTATKDEMNSAFTEIKGDTYVQATDSLEALRDRGDSAWVTGGAGSVTVSPIAGTVASRFTSTDIELVQYEQVNFGPLVITDTDGDAVSLSGVDLALVVFPLNGDTTEVWRWTTTDSELTVSGDDNNQITISDDATHTQAIGAWAWVLWDTTNDYPKQYGGTLAVKRCASPDAS